MRLTLEPSTSSPTDAPKLGILTDGFDAYREAVGPGFSTGSGNDALACGGIIEWKAGVDGFSDGFVLQDQAAAGAFLDTNLERIRQLSTRLASDKGQFPGFFELIETPFNEQPRKLAYYLADRLRDRLWPTAGEQSLPAETTYPEICR